MLHFPPYNFTEKQIDKNQPGIILNLDYSTLHVSRGKWSLEMSREVFIYCSILLCCFATHFEDCRFAWASNLRNGTRLLMVGWLEGRLCLSALYSQIPICLLNYWILIFSQSDFFPQFFFITFYQFLACYCQLHRNRTFKVLNDLVSVIIFFLIWIPNICYYIIVLFFLFISFSTLYISFCLQFKYYWEKY